MTFFTGALATADSSGLAREALGGFLAQTGGGQQGGFMSTMVFVVLMVGIFYLMLWRPQQKQAKEHKQMLAALKKGDAVVTNGGIIAKVHSVAQKFIVLELAREVRVRVLPSSIASKAPEGLFDEPETKPEAKGEAKAEKGEGKDK